MTVKNLLIDSIKDSLNGEAYYLCMNKACDIAYYDSSYNQIFKQSDLKVPLWYKEGAEPKYICYCNKITEKEIINAIVNEGAKTVKQLNDLTGAMRNCNCEMNHPTGKCCSTQMNEVLKRYS